MNIDKKRVFEEAIEVLEERGWCAGTNGMGYSDDPVCLLGSCYVAIKKLYPEEYLKLEWEHESPYELLKSVSVWSTLADVTGCAHPYDWNDRLMHTPGRSKSEAKQLVREVLAKAAELG